jgi:hypothetical protein
MDMQGASSSANAWHVTGERDKTITGLPSFTAWRHNWITSRASDRRVDNAMMHATALTVEMDEFEANGIPPRSGSRGGMFTAFVDPKRRNSRTGGL